MYIHKTYSINNQCKEIKEYKHLLKDLCKLNLRRSSKFNTLALLGALYCMKDQKLDRKTGIYVCSEYGAITSVKKVLDEISKDAMIMPFDFLNINSNNVSFYVSQALETNGKNMLLTSEDLSFEKGLEMALFDLEINEVEDVLLGKVDESLNGIKNLDSNDYSGWLYINKIKKNSLCKIELIESFDCLDDLNKKIKSLEYECFYLNQFAKIKLDKIDIDRKKIIENTTLDTIEHVFSFFENSNKNMACISMDQNNNGTILYISK